MKVTTRSESMDLESQSEPERFTGLAGFRVLHTMDMGVTPPAGASASPDTLAAGTGTWNTYPGNVSMVRYEPGVRSHWHSHSGGQMLFVVEGDGWVQSRGSDPIAIQMGDAISIAPGEEHWHGAKNGAALAHVTVTAGRPTWFEESPTPE
ncbi:MAG: cupin domain-containing protein [Candidatus Dormibacteria bacterium]